MGEGEGGMIWENGTETCIISYKKLITSPDSMQDTGCLGLVHWDDPEGWYGEGGGRRVHNGEYMYTSGAPGLGRQLHSQSVVFSLYGHFLPLSLVSAYI